jgi:hypothetical protein
MVVNMRDRTVIAHEAWPRDAADCAGSCQGTIAAFADPIVPCASRSLPRRKHPSVAKCSEQRTRTGRNTSKLVSYTPELIGHLRVTIVSGANAAG